MVIKMNQYDRSNSIENENIQSNRIFRGSPRYYERVRNISLGERPLDFIGINLPGRCNYSCTGCLSGMNQNQASNCQISQTEQIFSWIDQARYLGARHIEISGEGEPLLFRPALMRIIQYATTNNIHTTVFTNGSLIDRPFLEFIRDNDASLAISLSEINSERYRSFNHNGNLDQVLQAITNAREILGGPIIENNQLVYPFVVHAMVTPNNLNEIPLLSESLEEEILFSCAPVIDRNSAISQEINNIVNRYSQTNIILSDNALRDFGRDMCGTFVYGIGIRSNGDILFDAHAYSTAGLFGNANETDLSTLLSRVRASQRLFLNDFSDNRFCPLRNMRFEEFERILRQGCE
jgi:sulfatase maturation enzyme AslB (radical SAM superfamily)